MFLRPITETPIEKRDNARCKKLRELCTTIIIELQVTLAQIDKEIPSEHIPILKKAIEDSSHPVNKIENDNN